MIRVVCFLLASVLALGAQSAEPPLRVAIAGLAHGHVDGFFRSVAQRSDVQIAGIFEPDATLHAKYAAKYGFAKELFFTDLNAMLDRVKPEAVAAFTSTFDHPAIVEAAGKHHIDVMMEKPLAVSMDHARRIQKAAVSGGIDVIVNYETTWYRSHLAMRHFLEGQGQIRKMIAMDGHSGPKEIGVGPEFLSWLIDPVKNGAGALYDFGCYGANLMTWLMNNQRPLAVTALTHTDKPQTYAHVDDEATILIQYRQAQGIIQGSWNWPFSRKDFEVYTEHASAVAVGGDTLRVRAASDRAERQLTPEALPGDEADSVFVPQSRRAQTFEARGLVVARKQHDRGRDSRRRPHFRANRQNGRAPLRLLNASSP